MPFDVVTKNTIHDYATRHTAAEDWYKSYFDFIEDQPLAERLTEEFIAARYIYKILEGMSAENWLLRAQVRVQILQYASIYEAIVHHILFSMFEGSVEVQQLLYKRTLKRIDIPQQSRAMLSKHLHHAGKDIITVYETTERVDQTKIRFDTKVKCAQSLGLIDDSLGVELIEIYEARNAIHIHAEIRKGMSYEIELSKRAYRRLQPFRTTMIAELRRRGLYNK